MTAKHSYQFSGSVVGVLSAPLRGGAIFRIRRAADARPVRAVAPYTAIANPPHVGEFWTVHGHLVKDDIYGIQFIVESAFRERPCSDAILPLLCRHPDFSGLSFQRAKSLWRRWGPDIYKVLDDYDLVSLHRRASR